MVSRRALLRVLGTSLAAGAAGCNAFTDGNTSGNVTTTDGGTDRIPTREPTATLSPVPTGGGGSRTTRPTLTHGQVRTGGQTETTTATAEPTPRATASPTSTLPDATGLARLTPDASDSGHEFGKAVALSATAAVAVGGGQRGYAFEADDGWSERSILTPADAESVVYLDAVAVADDTAVVGAPIAGSAGAVFVFEPVGNVWQQRARVTPDDDPESYVRFGASIDYDGDRLVVGAVHPETIHGSLTGKAFIFDGSGGEWSQRAVVTTGAEDLFGTTVAVDGDTAVVGAPAATVDEEARAGSVYVYRREGDDWIRAAALEPAAPASSHGFARAVALDGDTALVGSEGDDGGRTVVFERDDREWQRRATIVSPAGPTGDFGQAVALAGDTALVGAPGEGDVGRAYAVRRTDRGWTTDTVLVADDPHPDADFGVSVALAGDAAVVGAPVFRESTPAYLYDL